MRLPRLGNDRLNTAGQVQFGGLNHTLGARDGELWDMKNLASDHYPVLASRNPRLKLRTLEKPGGLYCWEKLCWVDGDGFFFDGERKGTVTEGKKTFAALGAYVVIIPDKAWYNVDSGEFGNLECRWSGERLTFTNGTLYGEGAECNTLQAEGTDWAALGFRSGDAVTVSGCEKHPENNKTPVIREIDGDKLYFYEYVFALDGEEGTDPYDEIGTLRVERTVPDLNYLCENENRLWGCDGRTIYACKPGDIFNWNVFEGLDSDSYAADTGSAGTFTGCCSFMGYPVFFKENCIYKVYGSLPSNFEVMGGVATLGVAAGSAGSLAIAGEVLFYLSRAGVVAYQGGVPQPIGEALGTGRFRNAVGGSDGLKYYVSMEDDSGARRLCVYDTQRGLWHIEDNTDALDMTVSDGALYWLTRAGELWAADASAVRERPEGTMEEGTVEWWAETADFTGSSPNKKGIGPEIQIRLELDEGAEARVLLRYDSQGDWMQAGEVMSESVKRSYILPVVPRRADHCRIRIEGRGGVRVYSLARREYQGSELKSLPGRQ